MLATFPKDQHPHEALAEAASACLRHLTVHHLAHEYNMSDDSRITADDCKRIARECESLASQHHAQLLDERADAMLAPVVKHVQDVLAASGVTVRVYSACAQDLDGKRIDWFDVENRQVGQDHSRTRDIRNVNARE